MPQSTARKARGPTDLRSETSDPSLAWRLDPALQSVSQFGLVTLAPTTQRAMEKLWKVLDRDGTGSLTADDWITDHDGVEKWDTLREKLGANQEVFSISYVQFIEGLKAVALHKPMDPPASLAAAEMAGEMTGFAWAAWLTTATNSAILDLCEELYTAVTRQATTLWLTKETRRQLDELWRLLDTDGNGVLTAADWAASPGGDSKWDLLRKHFDLNNSASIFPEEFVAEIKTLALLQCGRTTPPPPHARSTRASAHAHAQSEREGEEEAARTLLTPTACYPCRLAERRPLDTAIFANPITNHSDMMKALNSSCNRAMQNLCKELFKTVRSSIQQ